MGAWAMGRRLRPASADAKHQDSSAADEAGYRVKGS